jgi:hypothetical protein
VLLEDVRHAALRLPASDRTRRPPKPLRLKVRFAAGESGDFQNHPKVDHENAIDNHLQMNIASVSMLTRAAGAAGGAYR